MYVLLLLFACANTQSQSGTIADIYVKNSIKKERLNSKNVPAERVRLEDANKVEKKTKLLYSIYENKKETCTTYLEHYYQPSLNSNECAGLNTAQR